MMLMTSSASDGTQRDRVGLWLNWMNQTRAGLAALAGGEAPPDLRDLLVNGYAANEPMLVPIPRWPALDWTLEGLKHRLGDAPVEVQVDRVGDVDYEILPHLHRHQIPFSAFIDRIMSGPDNDVYLTGRNAEHNRAALAPLFADISPLPHCIRSPADFGLLWLGGRTITPLHHDLCNTLLCQIMGRKLVRLIHPLQVGRVENHFSVFSRLGWVTEEMATARGLVLTDFLLTPGQALFLPVGWWHCVRALDPSTSVSFTNFLWANQWAAGFPPD